MGREEIKDGAALIALVKSLESNVVPTGSGSLPNKPQDGSTDYFRTAIDATRSKMTDPMQMLDIELLVQSPRLERLVAATAVAKERARFTQTTPATKTTARKQPQEPGTTIYVGNTLIRPVGA